MGEGNLRTCVHPSGRFAAGIHKPSYKVMNNRLSTALMTLGRAQDGTEVLNDINFPSGDLIINSADWVYEVPNAFPMWGVTYILGKIAEYNGSNGLNFTFEPRGTTSFDEIPGLEQVGLDLLPRPILLAIAQTCTHAPLLKRLLPLCADFEYDHDSDIPKGIKYVKGPGGKLVPAITDHDLYETLGNNPCLPDDLKRVMLLDPGIQGTSPVVGEYVNKSRTHIWEYLRANSYIPWGHFAANMAQDSIRYSVKDLDIEDILGLRHLYYQRIYCKMALHLGMNMEKRGLFNGEELEQMRLSILDSIKKREMPFFTATLWGWNYGYDFSPSGFRLHASHQQIHQQFALIPEEAEPAPGSAELTFPSYAIGDSIAAFIGQYRQKHSVSFFDAYIRAVREGNKRLDCRKDLPSRLVIEEDENAMLFVPKAQRSQGEIQIMALKPAGNILEADSHMRLSLDRLILSAVKLLAEMGARMITCFEMSKRFTADSDQRLMYCFLPRHPRSPGAFSEQQGRWVTGHFPEDYAECCRRALGKIRT